MSQQLTDEELKSWKSTFAAYEVVIESLKGNLRSHEENGRTHIEDYKTTQLVISWLDKILQDMKNYYIART